MADLQQRKIQQQIQLSDFFGRLAADKNLATNSAWVGFMTNPVTDIY